MRVDVFTFADQTDKERGGGGAMRLRYLTALYCEVAAQAQ
jgi:hypothetical protein